MKDYFVEPVLKQKQNQFLDGNVCWVSFPQIFIFLVDVWNVRDRGIRRGLLLRQILLFRLQKQPERAKSVFYTAH